MESTKQHKDLHNKINPEGIFILLVLFLILYIPNTLAEANSNNVFYSLQLGSFQDEDNARAMAEGLKRLGHNAFYRSEKKGQEEIYKVFIERYDTRQEAEKEAEVMKSLDLIAAYTIKKLKDDMPTTIQQKEIYPKGYYLYIESNKVRKSADETVEDIKKTGRNAFYRYEDVPGKGKWYRVYIDGYDSRQEALKDAQSLKNAGLIKSYELMLPNGTDKANIVTIKHMDKEFYLHIESYKDSSNAEKKVKELINQGFEAFFKEEESSGTIWFKVYIGVFESEESARKTGSELKRKGIIVYYKPVEINEDLVKE